MDKRLPNNLILFIWHFLKPYKRVVALYIGIALLAGCWGPFNSMLIKHIINLLSVSHPDSVFLLTWPTILIALNFIIFDNITWRAIGYLDYKFQPLIKKQMINESSIYASARNTHNNLPHFSNDHISNHTPSEVIMLADNVERILHPIASDFIRGISLLIIALISMYFVNPVFFYTLGIWFIVFTSFSIVMSIYIVKLSDPQNGSISIDSKQQQDNQPYKTTNINKNNVFARHILEVLHLKPLLYTSKTNFQTKALFLIKLNIVQAVLISAMISFMAYFLIQLYEIRIITVGDFALILGLAMEIGHIAWHTMSQIDEFNIAIGKSKQALQSLIIK